MQLKSREMSVGVMTVSSLFFPRICFCTTEEGESGYEEKVVVAQTEGA